MILAPLTEHIAWDFVMGKGQALWHFKADYRQAHHRLSSCIGGSLHMQLQEWMLLCRWHL